MANLGDLGQSEEQVRKKKKPWTLIAKACLEHSTHLEVLLNT